MTTFGISHLPSWRDDPNCSYSTRVLKKLIRTHNMTVIRDLIWHNRDSEAIANFCVCWCKNILDEEFFVYCVALFIHRLSTGRSCLVCFNDYWDDLGFTRAAQLYFPFNPNDDHLWNNWSCENIKKFDDSVQQVMPDVYRWLIDTA